MLIRGFFQLIDPIIQRAYLRFVVAFTIFITHVSETVLHQIDLKPTSDTQKLGDERFCCLGVLMWKKGPTYQLYLKYLKNFYSKTVLALFSRMRDTNI